MIQRFRARRKRSFPRIFLALPLLSPLLIPLFNSTRHPSSQLSAQSLRTLSIEEALERKNNFAAHALKEGRKVFAVYLPWYGGSERGWTHWSGFGHRPEGVEDTNTASVYHPLTGLYDSSDERLIRYHIELAQAAGVDGFIVDWYAGKEEHDRNLELLLREAEKRDFTIAVMYETRLCERNWRILKNHLRKILDEYADSPAYQRVGGVPVIHVFGMVSSGLTLGDFARASRELIAEGRAEGKNYVFAMVGDSAQKVEYLNVASAVYEWINLGAFEANPAWRENPDAWEHQARRDAYRIAKNRRDILVAGSVYCGFDDAKLGGGDWGKGRRRFLDDGNGSVAEKTIRYAVERKHPWVIVQTFNDWNEGTEFEPSLEKGFDRIWQLLRLSARLKGISLNPNRVVKIVERFAKSQIPVLDGPRLAALQEARFETVQLAQDLRQGSEEFRAAAHSVAIARGPEEEAE